MQEIRFSYNQFKLIFSQKFKNNVTRNVKLSEIIANNHIQSYRITFFYCYPGFLKCITNCRL